MSSVRRARLILIVVGGVGIACVTLLLIALGSVVRTSSAGGTLRAADYELTPLSIDESAKLGDELARDGRSFYVVRVRLADRSATANFHFDPHQILLRSVGEGKPVRSARGQRALGSDGSADVSPGGDCIEAIVFEAARGMKRMTVRFNLLGGPGELMTGLFGQNPVVELPVTPSGSK